MPKRDKRTPKQITEQKTSAAELSDAESRGLVRLNIAITRRYFDKLQELKSLSDGISLTATIKRAIDRDLAISRRLARGERIFVHVAEGEQMVELEFVDP
jgi:hypothetical protein